jgi:5-hydroxyisourate hydrolase
VTGSSAVTTHVLDTGAGLPAVGVAVRLERLAGGEVEAVAQGHTDVDGRVSDLGPEMLATGTYRLVFSTGEWFAEQGRTTFYPQVVVVFFLGEDRVHHHVPLLLSPFAYSTYRGN